MDRETKRLYLTTFLDVLDENNYGYDESSLDVFFDKIEMDENFPCKDRESLFNYWTVELDKR